MSPIEALESVMSDAIASDIFLVLVLSMACLNLILLGAIAWLKT